LSFDITIYGRTDGAAGPNRYDALIEAFERGIQSHADQHGCAEVEDYGHVVFGVEPSPWALEKDCLEELRHFFYRRQDKAELFRRLGLLNIALSTSIMRGLTRLQAAGMIEIIRALKDPVVTIMDSMELGEEVVEQLTEHVAGRSAAEWMELIPDPLQE
jgi:hypothetical protein